MSILVCLALSCAPGQVAVPAPAPTLAPTTQGVSIASVRRARQRQAGSGFGPRPVAPELSFQSSQPLTPMGPCSPASTWPFSARYSPDGTELFVPLFGGYSGQGGCEVQRLDATTLQWLGSIPVGESPEEIAFTTLAPGVFDKAFVTNSSASTVTVFDPNDQVLATVPIPVLPTSPFGTAFPFGIAIAPDQGTAWIGTFEGRVFALDTQTLTIDPTRTLDFGADYGFARMLFEGDRLVLTAYRSHPNWQGSTASIIFIDPDQPSGKQEVILATSNTNALYPTPQDLALGAGGRLYVAGFDMGAQVFVLDSFGPDLVATWPTQTQPAAGKFQALALHGDFLVVADTWSGEIARMDTSAGGLAGKFPLGPLGQGPNELTFAPNGQSLIVTMAGSGALLRLGVH